MNTWNEFRERPDEVSFRRLYDETRGRVWALCARISRTPEEAEEAFQATWFRALRIARGLEGAPREREAAAALSRLALREAGNARHRAERRRRLETSISIHAGHARPDSPLELASDAEVRDRVRGLLAALPGDERRALELRFFHDLSVREIASALDASKSVISDRITRALRRLRPSCRRTGLGDPAAALSVLAPLLRDIEPTRSAIDCFTGARVALSRASAASTASISTLGTAGVLAMKAKTGIVALLIVIVGLSIAFWPSSPNSEVEPPGSRSQESDEVSSPGAATRTVSAADARATNAGEAVAEATGAPPPGDEPAVVGPRLIGRVIDVETEKEIANASIRIDAGRQVARSDESGEFAFSLDGTGGPLRFVAVADGYAATATEILFEGGAGDVEHVFRLDPGVVAQITVVDEDARPIAGARVVPPRFGSGGVYSDEGVVLTDPEGHARVPNLSRLRPPQLLVSREGFESRYPRVAIGAEGRAEPLRVVLVRTSIRRRVVTGRITDTQGFPVPAAIVEWKDATGMSFGPDVRYGEPSVRSDAAGNYRLEVEDSNERCHLGVAAVGFAPRVERSVRLGSEDAPTTRDIELAPAHRLRGRVVDESGKALAAVSIEAMPERSLLHEGMGYPSVLRTAKTDHAGRFEIPEVAGPGCALRLRAKGRPTLELDVDVRDEVEIVLPAFGVVSGRVVDARSGEPIPAFNVRYQGQSQLASTAFTGQEFRSDEGRFVIRGLSVEPAIAVRVFADGYAPLVLRDLEPGSEASPYEHEFRLAPVEFLDGVVVDARTGAPLAGVSLAAYAREDAQGLLAISDWESLRHVWELEVTRTDADGRFQVRDSTSDPPTLLLRAPGFRRLVIEPAERSLLADGESLVVPLRSAERVRGRALDVSVAGRRVGLYRIKDLASARLGNLSVLHGECELDERGRFSFDDVSPGDHVLDLPHPVPGLDASYRSRTRRVFRVEEGADLEIELSHENATATLQGTLEGAAEEGVVFGEIVLIPLQGERTDSASADARSAGETLHLASTQAAWGWRFAFESLVPGVYRAELRLARAGGDLRETIERLEVLEGANLVDLRKLARGE